MDWGDPPGYAVLENTSEISRPLRHAPARPPDPVCRTLLRACLVAFYVSRSDSRINDHHPFRLRSAGRAEMMRRMQQLRSGKDDKGMVEHPRLQHGQTSLKVILFT